MSLHSLSPPPSPRRLIKTALHQAVLDCRLHQVRLLVSKHGANVNSKDLNGRTPLMLACLIDEVFGIRMAKILIKAGAELDGRDSLGRTALTYACMNGRETIVRIILSEDMLNINEPDNDGNTPLHHAAASGKPRITEFLIDCFVKFGLNVDTRNNLGYTALLITCKNGNYVSAYFLLDKGTSSPTLRDSEFFLNASEWLQRSHDLSVTKRYFHQPPPTPPAGFTREMTMYSRSLTPICRHVKSRPNIMTLSAGSLQLPFILAERCETFFDGKDARQLVFNQIDKMECRQTSASSKTGSLRQIHPSTAKLRSFTKRSKTSIIPDIAMIFRAYSEQYEPDWRRLKMTYGDKERACVDVSTDLPAIEVSVM